MNYWLQTVMLGAGVALLLAGCGLVDSEPEVITLTGTWEGDTTRGDIQVAVELFLEQSAPTVVSGSGLLTEDGEEASFSVASTSYAHPTISMQWQFSDRPPISLSGTVSDELERIEGTLSGASFAQNEITLVKR